MSLQDLFKRGCESVLPDVLVDQAIRLVQNPEELYIEVTGKKIPLTRPVNVVAFGKASLGMCTAVMHKLGYNNIAKAIVSTPHGSVETLRLNGLGRLIPESEKVIIMEGAKGNYPDQNACLAAEAVENMVKSLRSEQDIVIVLVSGGGSALLPAPISGLSLQDKCDVIVRMSKGGASITQLNTVRHHLSRLKGGKLAQLARPGRVIGVIFSDIIGDEIEFVASGPTVQSSTTKIDAINLISQFVDDKRLKDRVIALLKESNHPETDANYDHVTNVLVGNNATAISAISGTILTQGDHCVEVMNNLEGEASERGVQLAQLAHKMLNYDQQRSGSSGQNWPMIPESKISTLLQLLNDEKALYLIWGGETTVTIPKECMGIGGRNQELVLAFILEMRKFLNNNQGEIQGDISILSGGTDGQDGPNDAAGAWINLNHIQNMTPEDIDLSKKSLQCHDSYNFFRVFRNGENHMVTGLTGTNVMDIIIMKFVAQ